MTPSGCALQQKKRRWSILASASDFFVTARYALYFAPRPGSAWARFGERSLAGTARRYGFHATLKAPFRLAKGVGLAELISEVDAWSAAQSAFVMPPLEPRRLEDFHALVPAAADSRLVALAADCVVRFDRFRAPLSDAEVSRRRARALSPRQEALLARWGYPYVLDEFRFHLSLSGPGAPAPQGLELPGEALLFDALSIFYEPVTGADFHLAHRAAFRMAGRLVYVAGPSGAGKDSVLRWAKERLRPDAPVAFARRAITRAADDTESHEALTEAQFEARLRRGEFAMAWGANGHRYGIGAQIREWLVRGVTVVVSGSREYLPHALRDFPGMEVVLVTAPEEVRRRRLGERGRETEHMAARRLERARRFYPPAHLVSAELSNDGDLAVPGRRFLEYLENGKAL
jgi:ribose 1,5-bisphosphokinase